MFRNDYDTDTTTFDPDGRLHQVEFAVKAIHNGGTVVGLRSKTHALLVALKRTQSELASYQEKIYKIDSHIGIGMAGILPDGRVLTKFMRDECMNHNFVYGAPMQTERLVVKVSDKSQRYTQTTEKRPYGIGLLVAGYDKTGPHIFETIPTGSYLEYEAQAIGARYQAAKTYLQKSFETFGDKKIENLIMDGLTALKGSSQKKLTSKNVVIGYVGPEQQFVTLDGDALDEYIDQLVQDDDENEEEDIGDDDEKME